MKISLIKTIVMAFVLCATQWAYAYDNEVYASNTESQAGKQVVLPIQMKNTIAATGFQVDIFLPEGITVAEDGDGFPMVELSTQRTTPAKTNVFDCDYQTDGSLRILCNSTKGIAFTGNDGEVALVTLNITEGLAEGDYTIALRNIVITESTGTDKRKVDETLAILKVVASSEEGGEDEPSGADTDITGMSNVVYIEAQQIEPGQTVEVPILLKNSLVTTGFTFTLVLPEGLSIVLDEEGYPDVVAVLDRFDAANHASCYGDFNDDGSVEVTCGTTNATRYKLSGNEGAVATIKVKASASMAEGKYPIMLKDITIANEEETTIASVQTTFTYGDSWECSHIHGDVNGDGEVTIEDVNEVIDILLKKKK